MSSNATAGDETRVNTYTTDVQAGPSMTGLADGGWLVTWFSRPQDGDGNGIYQQRYDADGDSVGAETHVSTYTTGAQSSPSVTTLADGGWVVTWNSGGQDGDDNGIYQQRYHADGTTFGAETAVNTYTTGSQRNTSVTSLSDGGWVVTWTSQGIDDNISDIGQRRYDVNGAAVGGETIVNTYATLDQHEQSVAALAGGGWVVTWSSQAQDGNGYGIYQQRYDGQGLAASSETEVNTFTTGSQEQSSVTGLADGGWAVAWASRGQDGSLTGIYLQRYDASGATDGVETQVNTYTNADQQGVSITALSDGGWVVAWHSDGQDGDGSGIYQQRYDADGAAAGTETLVNAYSTGEQSVPSVTALDDGSWVVSWSSLDQDGDRYGVYQRHYAPDRIGTSGGETLRGTSWSETISGDSGADTLKGLGGSDVIDGGRGRDILSGGAGEDMFLFMTGDSNKAKSKADIILDMTHADQIDLHLIDARETPIDDQAFKFIGTKDFHGHEGELRYEKLKSDTYVYGDTDGDRKADFAIHLDDAMKLKAEDFAL